MATKNKYTWKAQGEPNLYMIFKNEDWYMGIQLNGQEKVNTQENTMEAIVELFNNLDNTADGFIRAQREADEISNEDLEAAVDLLDSLKPSGKEKRGLSSIIQESDFEDIMFVEAECDETVKESEKARLDTEALLKGYIGKTFREWCEAKCTFDKGDDDYIYYDNYAEYLGWDIFPLDTDAYYES